MRYQIAARLDPERQLTAEVGFGLAQNVQHTRPVGFDIEGGLAGPRRNAESAADVQGVDIREVAGDARQATRAFEELPGLENSRTDVRVQADDASPARCERRASRRQLLVVQSELGVDPAGDDVNVMAGTDPRVDAQKNVAPGARRRETLHVGQRAQVDARTRVGHRAQGLRADVVRREQHVGGGNAVLQCALDLHGRDGVDPHALLPHQIEERRVEVGLARVGKPNTRVVQRRA